MVARYIAKTDGFIGTELAILLWHKKKWHVQYQHIKWYKLIIHIWPHMTNIRIIRYNQVPNWCIANLKIMCSKTRSQRKPGQHPRSKSCPKIIWISKSGYQQLPSTSHRIPRHSPLVQWHHDWWELCIHKVLQWSTKDLSGMISTTQFVYVKRVLVPSLYP